MSNSKKATKVATKNVTKKVTKVDIQAKRFVMRKSLVGKNQIIEVTFKDGKKAIYNHDKAYEIIGEKLEKMPCWEKYSTYTCTNNLPVILRDKKLV